LLGLQNNSQTIRFTGSHPLVTEEANSETIKYEIRPAIKADEPLLWQMLCYASHMDEDGVPLESAKMNPDLAGYVEDWATRDGDLGFVAVTDGQAKGAAWVRVMPESPLYRLVERGTPELAIAVLPDQIGCGIGTRMLQQLLAAARGKHHMIVLSVRADNSAKRLYERFGFTSIAEITNRVGTRSFVMTAKLD
jgi:ribosomal protein S18 acetylase RimI-like enzyme